MNSVHARAALQQVVLGSVLVATVVLVTVCFNVIGILACSILTGLMLGASRQWKWHIIFISLLFPVASLSFLEFSRGDVVPRVRLLFALLCWAGFVVTYGLAYLLVYFEHHTPASSDTAADHVLEAGATTPEKNVPAEPAPPSPPDRLTANFLQGQWSYESPSPNGQSQKKVLQVTGDELLLYVTASDGHITCQAKAHMTLD